MDEESLNNTVLSNDNKIAQEVFIPVPSRPIHLPSTSLMTTERMKNLQGFKDAIQNKQWKDLKVEELLRFRDDDSTTEQRELNAHNNENTQRTLLELLWKNHPSLQIVNELGMEKPEIFRQKDVYRRYPLHHMCAYGGHSEIIETESKGFLWQYSFRHSLSKGVERRRLPSIDMLRTHTTTHERFQC
jgi:hypothetical protein